MSHPESEDAARPDAARSATAGTDAPRTDIARTGAAQTDALLAHLMDGGLDPAAVAAKEGLSIVELARWALQPEHDAMLAALVRLADARAQLIVSRYRVSAAVRLVEIATGDDVGELARRACVDLLRADLPRVTSRPDLSATADASPPPADAASIRSALEQLGASS